jgi:hypothetical protein
MDTFSAIQPQKAALLCEPSQNGLSANKPERCSDVRGPTFTNGAAFIDEHERMTPMAV